MRNLKKTQHTSEYNKKRSRLTDIENELVVTSGEGGQYRVKGEPQTIRCKISHKGVLYNTGNIANIL